MTAHALLKYSGIAAPHDLRHQPRVVKAVHGLLAVEAAAAPDEQWITPTTVTVDITTPPGTGTITLYQYGPTVVGSAAAGYAPATDCDGAFMSYKNQINNNCYAYGCNIATSTFPQPGRASGYQLTKDDFSGTVESVGQTVSSYAEKDGLILVGPSISDLLAYKEKVGDTLSGHFVALMISPSADEWYGDYHWARCDNSSGACDVWSQKDGGDQVTNFDFAGVPLVDPAIANWTVNQGPPNSKTKESLVVSYGFYTFMFVPHGAVTIV